MKTFDITIDHSLERSLRRLEGLGRFAQRRAEFIETLDLCALGTAIA